jgi:hypothetical protein
MDARNYQNLLHFVGATSSFLTIFGVFIVGSGNMWGIVIMLTGAIFTRISSEIEFRKMREIVREG